MSEQPLIQVLLADLRREIARAREPKLQAIEVRSFLESVHVAMGRIFGFDPKTVLIDQWFERIRRVAKTRTVQIAVHSGLYSPLKAFLDEATTAPQLEKLYEPLAADYRQGNIAAHPNAAASISTAHGSYDALRRIEDLIPLLDHQLAALGFDLGAEFLRCRDAAGHRHRAQLLFDAILAGVDGATERLEAEVWPAVRSVLRDVDAPGLVSLAKNPNTKLRVHRALTINLANRAAVDRSCALARVADLLALDLSQWRLEDRVRVEYLRVLPRGVDVFRVHLESDGIVHGGTIRSAYLFLRGQPTRELDVGSLPAANDGRGVLANLLRLFNRAADELRRQEISPPKPTEVVLQLAVDCAHATDDWESIRHDRHGTLAQQFLAVAVDPLDPEEMTVRAELEEPLDCTRMALVWTADHEVVREETRSFSVLLAGPLAWRTAPDVLPAVLCLLSGKAAALLLAHEDPANALREIGIEDLPSTRKAWAELVSVLGTLQRRPDRPSGAYRIYLNEARYVPAAYGL